MHTFTTSGVIVKCANYMQYRKAYVLSKYGCWSGYIPSWLSVHLDILTYATCIWEGKTADSVGTWMDFLDPIHLSANSNTSRSSTLQSVSGLGRNNTVSSINYSMARSSIVSDTTSFDSHNSSYMHSIAQSQAPSSSISAHTYPVALYIAQLCMCLPEHYADQNIWTAMLKAIGYLKANQWIHAWFIFEMSIIDMQYNRFDYTSKHYLELSSVNNNKIAQYADKYTMKLRAKLHKSLYTSIHA